MLLTNAGCELVKLLADPRLYEDSRILQYALGTDETPPTSSDGEMGAQFFEKRVKSIRIEGDQLSVRCEANRTEANTSGLPIVEYGLNTAGGVLVAREVHDAIEKNYTNKLYFVFAIDFTIPEIQDVDETSLLPSGERLTKYVNSGDVLTLNILSEVFPEYEGILVVTAVNGSSSNVGNSIVLESGALLTITANGFFTLDTTSGYVNLLAGAQYSENIVVSINQVGYIVDLLLDVVVTKQGAGDVVSDSLVYTVTLAPLETATGNILDGSAFSTLQNTVISSVKGDSSNVGHGVEGSSGGIFIIKSSGNFTFSSGSEFNTIPEGGSRVSIVPFEVQHDGGSIQGEIRAVVVSTTQVEMDGQLVFVRPNPAMLPVSCSENSSLSLFDYLSVGDASTVFVKAVGGAIGNVGLAVPSSLNQGGTWKVTSSGAVTFSPGTHFLYLSALESSVVKSPSIFISNGARDLEVYLEVTVEGSGVGYSLVNPAYYTCNGEATISGDALVNCGNPAGSAVTVTGVINSINADVQSMAGLYVGIPMEAASSYERCKGWFVVRSDGSFEYTPGDSFATIAAGTVVTNYVYIFVRNEGYDTQRTSLTVTVTKA